MEKSLKPSDWPSLNAGTMRACMALSFRLLMARSSSESGTSKFLGVEQVWRTISRIRADILAPSIVQDDDPVAKDFEHLRRQQSVSHHHRHASLSAHVQYRGER